jgi:hypothetical protein
MPKPNPLTFIHAAASAAPRTPSVLSTRGTVALPRTDVTAVTRG